MKNDPSRGEFFALNNWKYDSLALKNFLEKLVYNHWVEGEDRNNDPMYKIYLNMEGADGVFKGLVVVTDKLFKTKVEEMLAIHKARSSQEVTRRLIEGDPAMASKTAIAPKPDRHLAAVKSAIEDPKSNVVKFSDNGTGYYANEVICMQIHDNNLYVGTIDGLFILKGGMLEPVQVRV